jgi:serine/threonine-protein kinase
MKLGIDRSAPEHAGATPPMKLSAGNVIGERYRIQTLLGQGGMGVVYAAVHQHTGRAVALKLIHCPWDDDRLELYQRFLSEARAAAALRHPNVVDVLDLGFLAGAPYLVMEHLQGESLEDLLVRLEILPLESGLEWLLPLMGALAALHGKGIVHRDVKPSNIFLSRDEGQRVVPKLLDFGLARITRDAPLTQPGVMLGTPEYMAPERARGEAVGPSADVWAMGVVAFECLCGRLPFTATTLNGLAAQIVGGEVLRALEANPRLPGAIAAVIDRALQNAPEQRHPDMAHFAYALGAAALSAGLRVPPDPDPIGLPSFAALHLQGDAWASGPLAKVFAAAVAARGSAREQCNEAQRAPSTSSRQPMASEATPARPRSRRRRIVAFAVFAALALGVAFAAQRATPPHVTATSVPASASARAQEPAPAAPVREEAVHKPGSAAPLSVRPVAPDPLVPTPSAQAPGPRADRPEPTRRAARRAGAHSATKRNDNAIVPGSSEFEEEWK